MKWDVTKIPVPSHCATCGHITKLSPNIPVCYHPAVRANPLLPRIHPPPDVPHRPDWCPKEQKDKLSHSAEVMARCTEKKILKDLKNEMVEKGQYASVEVTPEAIRNIGKSMVEAGLFKPRIKLNTPEAFEEAMYRYVRESPHDDCSEPEEKLTQIR